MLKLYTWNTPNGRKVSIALEEMQIPYESIGIDIGSSEPRLPEFLIKFRRLQTARHRCLNRARYWDTLSIADFAIWPWTSRFEYQQIDLNDYQNVKRWYCQLAARPGFIKGYAQPDDLGPIPMPWFMVPPCIVQLIYWAAPGRTA